VSFMRNIVLIGFMGTGKSSVGRLLANRLRRPFIDTDKKIENDCGISIKEIFEQYGEQAFRFQERVVITKVSRYTNTVIATGGGVVLTPENVNRLKSNGILIALTASLDTILERTGRRNARPLLNGPDRKQTVAKLLGERSALYDVADYTIDTSIETPHQVVENIISFLRKGGHLRGRS